MAEDRTNEALEKLSRGIQESKQMVQHQTMELAQEYFSDSVEVLKQQIRENRATLKDLPEQIPGGQEEPFQGLFQELMDNYARIEESINEAEKNVSNLDVEQIRRQGEVDASDAARREARELGVDLTEVEGTGSGGRIIVDDVRSFAEETKDRAAEEEQKASDAAKRRAEELGVDLKQVAGSGAGGLITVKDVTSLAEGTQEQATGGAGEATQRMRDTTGQVTQQAQEAVGGAAEQARGVVGQVAGQAGQAVQGVQDTAGQAADQAAGQAAGGDEEPRATNAAKRKAEELGIDLSEVQGSGAGGLITIRDVTSLQSP